MSKSILLEPWPIRLNAGDFFGEIALLTDLPRTATVRAATATQLLVLRVRDFRKLLDAHEDPRFSLARVAEQRLGQVVTSG